MSSFNKESKIFVAGHRGLVGSAIVRRLIEDGYKNLILKTRQELDLTDQAAVEQFFADTSAEFVFLAAAKVGGILANSTHQADFLYENLAIATNVIHSAARNNVTKLIFLGSSCIYPKMAPQPLHEECLLTGPLEPTNEGYAIAKIAGLKLCEMYQRQYGKNFVSAMPTNLYGPRDNFDLQNSHVIPGMMRRFHEAKINGAEKVIVWGTGTPRREFLHVDDLAAALVLLMKNENSPLLVNIGTGEDCTILELANLMKEVTGFQGKIELDLSKPDGTPRKVLDVSRIRSLGWKHATPLKEGLSKTYLWAIQNKRL